VIYWVFGLGQTSGFLNKSMFLKLDAFQFSDEGVGDTHFVGSEKTNLNHWKSE
jgi:hypothetical protein